MPRPQSFASHARFDPPFHFLLAPVFLVNLGLAVYLTIHDWPAHARLHLWGTVMALALLLLLGLARRYAALNQDRIIRLEERLRLAALLPTAEHALLHTLTTRQFIALRFASDAEFPALARRAAAENLTAAEIKKAIVDWRPDYQRI